MSFQGPSASQGTFILPSFPLSSPRNSPKHLSAPAAPAGKSQEDPRSLSSSWPLKSFQGLPKPGCQKQLLSQKPGDSTGGNVLKVIKRDLGVVFWGIFQWSENAQWQVRGNWAVPQGQLGTEGFIDLFTYLLMASLLTSLQPSLQKWSLWICHEAKDATALLFLMSQGKVCL